MVELERMDSSDTVVDDGTQQQSTANYPDSNVELQNTVADRDQSTAVDENGDPDTNGDPQTTQVEEEKTTPVTPEEAAKPTREGFATSTAWFAHWAEQPPTYRTTESTGTSSRAP